MDTIFIRDLRVDARIGVHAWERRIRQRLVFDLELGTDARAAAASDDVADTLDYDAVSERVLAIAAAAESALIEHLAARVADAVVAEFPVRHLRLTLRKPGAVSAAREVGLVLERQGAA